MRKILSAMSTLVVLIVTAMIVPAASAAANLAQPGPGGGGGFCSAEFWSCDPGGDGYGGGSGGYGDGGGYGGGIVIGGPAPAPDPDPDPIVDDGFSACGPTKFFNINNVAWARKGQCPTRRYCLALAQDANNTAEQRGFNIRALCGSSTSPFGSGQWFWAGGLRIS